MRLCDTHKYKKIGSKRPFRASAVVRAIDSRQLDDQYKNPNMNNKDHLVGRLTTHPPPWKNQSLSENVHLNFGTLTVGVFSKVILGSVIKIRIMWILLYMYSIHREKNPGTLIL